jgi:hypothetical protein
MMLTWLTRAINRWRLEREFKRRIRKEKKRRPFIYW